MAEQNTFSLLFFGIKSRANEKGEIPLHMRITVNKQKVELALHIRVPISIFLYYTLFLVLVGSINLIILLLAKRMDNVTSVPSNKLLDVSNYSLKIGKLILFTLLASFVTIIFSKVFGSGQDLKFYKTVFRLISFASLLFYIKYSWHRLRDANISSIWLFVGLTIYASIYILRILLTKNHPSILGDFNFIAGILLNIFIAAQYSLFLIPSHSNER